jgi:hypothetical protein
MNEAIRRRIDTLEQRLGQHDGIEATKRFFDGVLEKGEVSQETIDAMHDKMLVDLFGLEKCDDGYWRIPSEANTSEANDN